MPKRLYVSTAPEKGRQCQGQRIADQFIDRRSGSRRPRAQKERVTGRTSQVKRRGQGAHRLRMGPPSFAALQRAHGMNRQARNCRELLLRKAGSLAERLELRGK